MANTANITSSNPAREGCFFRAPVGTELPANATTPLNEAFKDQGYVGEDGVSLSVTRETEDITAYGGEKVYTVQTDFGEEITLTLYESANTETLKTVFGDDNVIVSGDAVTVKHNKSRLPRSSFVFDHITDQGLKRQVVPVGQVASVGDITHVHSDIVKYELTLKTYPDTTGNTVLEYTAGDGGDELQVSTAVVKKGTKNAPLEGVQLIASGGKAPYTWELTESTTLPAGLSLQSDGRITGTPTEATTTTFTVKVTDSESNSAVKELSITIEDTAGG